jgi:arylsulfatase A-like enzyme
VWLDLAALLPPWEVPKEFIQPYFQEAEVETEAEAEEDEGSEGEELEPLFDPNPGLLVPPADQMLARLQHTYAAAISYVDAGVGLLLEELRQSGLADELLLLATTDHGQALGEHGMVGPLRPWLHDELIHLPLWMRLPGGTAAGRRVAALTQPVDLFPTLLDAFGIVPPCNHGHSLLPLARGEKDQVRAYACGGLRIDDWAEWVLRTPDWGFILPVAGPEDAAPRGPRLYVKPDDRWEVNDVLQHHLELAESLEQTLRAFVAATPVPGPFQPPALPESQVKPEQESDLRDEGRSS